MSGGVAMNWVGGSERNVNSVKIDFLDKAKVDELDAYAQIAFPIGDSVYGFGYRFNRRRLVDWHGGYVALWF